MTRLPLALIALPLIALSGCHVAAGLVVGCDELATEQRSPGAFDALESASFVGVNVSTGDEHQVTVTCDENLLEYIQTEVQGSTLVIRLQPGVAARTDLDCTADVVAPAWTSLTSSGSGYLFCDEVLEDLQLVGTTGSGDVAIEGIHTTLLAIGTTGSGNVGVSDLRADELELGTSGSGSVALLGAAPIFDLASTGSGDVYTRELVCEDVDASNTGSGLLEVHAAVSLSADLFGSGDVHVWGDPDERDVSVSGSGELIYH